MTIESKLLNWLAGAIQFIDKSSIEPDDFTSAPKRCKTSYDDVLIRIKPRTDQESLTSCSVYSEETHNNQLMEFKEKAGPFVIPENCYDTENSDLGKDNQTFESYGNHWHYRSWKKGISKQSNQSMNSGESLHRGKQAELQYLSSIKKKPNSLTDQPFEKFDFEVKRFSLSSAVAFGHSEHFEAKTRKLRKRKYTDCSFEDFVLDLSTAILGGLSLTEEAMQQVESILLHACDIIAKAAGKLVTFQKRKTLTLREIQAAIELSFPSKLAYLANHNASLQIRYMNLL